MIYKVSVRSSQVGLPAGWQVPDEGNGGDRSDELVGRFPLLNYCRELPRMWQQLVDADLRPAGRQFTEDVCEVG
jgi:hypothetical protein